MWGAFGERGRCAEHLDIQTNERADVFFRGAACNYCFRKMAESSDMHNQFIAMK